MLSSTDAIDQLDAITAFSGAIVSIGLNNGRQDVSGEEVAIILGDINDRLLALRLTLEKTLTDKPH